MKFLKIRKTIIFFIIVYILYFLIEFLFIPENINLTAGEKYTINLNSPFNATIYPQAKQAVYINETCVNDCKDVELDKDFQVSCDKGSANLRVKLFGLTLKEVNINAYDKKKLYPIGKTAGICVNTKGVLVLATGEIKDINGNTYEPAKNVIEAGDIITKVNNQKVYSNNDLKNIISNSEKAEISYIRGNKEYNTVINTIKSQTDSTNKIGLWVRDSTQGIGTITYYDPQTKTFGALGHPITDVDTGKLMEIESGEAIRASIVERQIGEKGNPGALIGNVNYDDRLGTINSNTETGIYGNIDYDYIKDYCVQCCNIAYKSEVKKGEAYILANIDGDSVEKYSILIENINKNDNGNKNFIIKVTDENLIKKTGGIVQGMSGCPIIQDNKIIGAVTHVFVNNPQKGYGIFIENMLGE